MLCDLSAGSTWLTLFGQIFAHPIFPAPVACQRMVHSGGELASALAEIGASLLR